jgi:DNA excision repair protein ERCC-2
VSEAAITILTSQSDNPFPIYAVSVRLLVEFILRRGDLSSGERTPKKLRAREGSLAHRKLQRSRPEGYETEISVTRDVPGSHFILRIGGRIDGLWNRPEGILLEEIKTVKSSWNHEPALLHWAQIKFYGFMICEERQLSEIELQLTYLELPSEQITVFREKISFDGLKQFFDGVTSDYRTWMEEQGTWKDIRNASIEEISFPYGAFRKGQRSLSAGVYKSILNAETLFAEAPTGIGKTMSVLFPAVKVMTAKRVDRLFYLTAKTVTQALAEKSFDDLRAAGLRFRTVTLTAKEKLCVRDGAPCNVLDCPLAIGYYDRLKPALREALASEALTRPRIEELARVHGLCPHEFSLDISDWVDAVICDYNHAFDPRASLKRHFGENNDAKVLLIDEAHNLLDRAREMFSAELDLREIANLKTELSPRFSKCSNALKRFLKEVEMITAEASLPLVRDNIPENLLQPLERFGGGAEQYFAETPLPDETLLEAYYTINAFLQIADYFGENYRLLLEGGETGQGPIRIRLFCLDPSTLLAEAFGRMEASVLFSATLTPLDYFRDALGGSKEDRIFKLNSPFPPEHLKLVIAPYIQTAFRHRSSSIDQLVEAIVTFARARKGNYLVYFPSYKYLGEVAPRLQIALGEIGLLLQRSEMDDTERVEFLNAFKADRSTSLVGCAVMGGVFGEGIDLMGERLIGAVIVGVGLPQLCLERDLIRQHFEEQGADGFARGYVFPGFNRVLQAVGRVIRSETDKGAVLLVDSRFTEERFSALFPPWWQLTRCSGTCQLAEELADFWSSF